MAFHKITLKVNGTIEQVNVPSQMTLLQLLRDELALTGTKNGCTAGECGACTVLMNGEPVNSCLVLAVECEGADIITVEGLAIDGQLDIVQQSIIDAGGVQCGFCTPGMLIMTRSLLDRSGTLCQATSAAARVMPELLKRSKRLRMRRPFPPLRFKGGFSNGGVENQKQNSWTCGNQRSACGCS